MSGREPGTAVNERRKAEICAAIERAFAARRHPGDERIGRDGAGCAHDEGTYVANFFRGKRWQDVTYPAIRQGYEGPDYALFSFMVPEGLAYYLPAFLVMALELNRSDPSPDGDVFSTFIESLCFHLTRPSPNSLNEQYEMVKGLLEVPDEIKESLRNPSEAARQAERTLVAEHDRLVELLSAEQRAVVRETLEYLAPVFRDDAISEEFNSASRALKTTWGRFGP